MVQSLLPGTEELLRACEALHGPHAVNEQHAEEFLQKFSFEQLVGVFTHANLQPAQYSLVQSALSRIFSTSTGSVRLLAAAPYLKLAASAPQAPLRRFAAEQLGRLLTTAPVGICDDDLADQLLELLKDVDTGVAATAERALVAWARAGRGRPARLLLAASPLGSKLQGMASSSAASGSSSTAASAETVQLRALAVALAVGGGSSSEGAEALSSSGMIESLSRQLHQAQADPLSAMGALGLLRELAEPHTDASLSVANGTMADATAGVHASTSASGLPAALHDVLLPDLTPLLQDPLLGPSALLVAASLLRSALSQGVASMAIDSGVAAGQSAGDHPLVVAVHDSLNPRGDATAEAESATLDAAGQLGLSRQGAELLLLCSRGVLIGGELLRRALGRSPHPGVRIAALHAAASVAGIERANELGERRAALMSQQAEQRLRESTYAACSETATTPAESILGLLHQPFPELRVAVYRFVAGMALRPWFAAEVCRHPALLDHLLTATSEAGVQQWGVQGAKWRHAAVHSVWLAAKAVTSGAAPEEASAAAHQATLSAVLPRVQQSLEAGPYGTSGRGAAGVGERQHLVATLP